MNVPPTTPPVPRELLSLRSATATYVAMLGDIDQWAEQAADVNRIIRPDYAESLDWFRDHLRAARDQTVEGSPASIADVVARLLGEA